MGQVGGLEQQRMGRQGFKIHNRGRVVHPILVSLKPLVARNLLRLSIYRMFVLWKLCDMHISYHLEVKTEHH